MPPLAEFRMYPPNHFQFLPDSWFRISVSDSIYGSTFIYLTESQSLVTCLKQTMRIDYKKQCTNSLLSPLLSIHAHFGTIFKSLLCLTIIIYIKTLHIYNNKKMERTNIFILLKNKESDNWLKVEFINESSF